jgi:hypothetical protein
MHVRVRLRHFLTPHAATHGWGSISSEASCPTCAAITVSVTTSDPVMLNGLVLEFGTGGIGILITSGPSVQILNSVVRHFQFGITDAPNYRWAPTVGCGYHSVRQFKHWHGWAVLSSVAIRFPKQSGSRAMLMAIRRASSLVKTLAWRRYNGTQWPNL